MELLHACMEAQNNAKHVYYYNNSFCVRYDKVYGHIANDLDET
jgi:hypothetical protein